MEKQAKMQRIHHDLKRIANALKMLSDEIDALFFDVEDSNKDNKGGNS